MRQIYLNGYFRGYNFLMKYISDIAHLKESDQKVIGERLKIIEFFDEFGLKATQKAFSRGRSTIFLWKKKLKQNQGRLSALRPEPKTPKEKRKREVHPLAREFIKEYRLKYHGVGKETITPVLNAYLKSEEIKSYSESTVGRVIGDLKREGIIQDGRVKIAISGKTGRLLTRKPKSIYRKIRRGGFIPKNPGDLVQIDTIAILIDGLRRYVITAYDVVTAFAFAMAYNSSSSKNTVDFMEKLISVTPFVIKRIQTDNGGEFEKHFRSYIQQKGIVHFHNYPAHPQSNGCLENFNRVIQRQYIDWHAGELLEPNQFNQGLMEYLVWYNTEKAHKRLGKIPPLKYYVDNYINEPQKSNMIWTLANTWQMGKNMV